MFNDETKNNILIKSIILSISLIIISFYNNDYNFLKINNYTNYSYPEKNANFSGYSTSIKAIALYIPKIKFILEYDFYKDFYPKRNLVEEINKTKDIIEKENNNNFENIEKQIELAKMHGIYGFGIYYYYNYYLDKSYYNDPLDTIYERKNIDFHYLIILKYNEDFFSNSTIKYFMKGKYNENNLNNIIDLIYKYLLDKRYIAFNNIPIIGIDSPEKIKNIKQTISIWRKKITDYGIEKIFILGALNNKKLLCNKEQNYIDGYAYLPTYNAIEPYEFENRKSYSYKGLIYDNLFEKSDCILFQSSLVPYKNENRNLNIFDDYSPIKFYISNQITSGLSINHFDKNNRFIFINSFNNLINEYFLKKDGFASINYLSKAIFNIPLIIKEHKLNNLMEIPLIAIQAHIYFIDLLSEIMNKINSIPVKFDLYISTTTEENKIIIEKYIEQNTKADKYEVLVVENKGRDVLPFILTMNKIYKHYKYFCHVHTKKTKVPTLGYNWRQYILNNLLGSKEIISEILYKLETNQKLGIIFPENYADILKYAYEKSRNLLYLNNLLGQIFPLYKLKTVPEFPASNMFWARVSAVYQVFDLKDYISYLCPIETGAIYISILHAVERIWIPLAQLNGYNYTTIFMYY